MSKIKELRAITKMSQSEFSKKFGIPIRTLQKWEQNAAEPLPYLLSLIQEEITLEEYIDMTKYMFKPQDKFKPVIDDKFKNIERVHPIQQCRINEIIKALKEYEEVQKIVVFGSSINHKCNYDSDIDLYVELSKNRNVKTYNVDCPVDFWTNFSVDPEMLKEIKNKGVVVYDR